MPLIAVFDIIFQVYFASHSIRTGKDRYWIFIIICFPGIGCLLYFFTEYLPELQYNARIRKSRTPKNPVKRIKVLKDQLELTPSIYNKTALAEAYVYAGQYENAISLYDSCLAERRNDTTLIEGMSIAYFFKGDLENAYKYLKHLKKLRGEDKHDKFDLLYARTLELMNNTEQALNAYESISKGFSGEEARVRYALLLKQTGKQKEANEQLSIVLKNARLAQKFYKKTQKPWIKIAQKECR